MTRCVIESCDLEIPVGQLMCRRHWHLVPRPIQLEIYGMARGRHKDGPGHRAAVARAIAAAQARLDRRDYVRAAAQAEATPGWLPYRDD